MSQQHCHLVAEVELSDQFLDLLNDGKVVEDVVDVLLEGVGRADVGGHRCPVI